MPACFRLFGPKTAPLSRNRVSCPQNYTVLVTKLRDLKMFKMAFQVVFSAKNVPRFSFGLLVAPKLKNREGRHNAPPPG